MTQSELAAASGLTVSYLSRVENSHATPSIATLSKLAAALGKPFTALFDGPTGGEPENGCPVSLNGTCILDHRFVAHGQRAAPDTKSETYDAKQLEIMRLCNYLLHTGTHEVVSSLFVMSRSLLALSERPIDASEVLPSAASTSHDESGCVSASRTTKCRCRDDSP
jgi:transcriptional regulator with XRE-family HTH domain